MNGDAGWPDSAGRPVVFLLEADTAVERRVLRRWVHDNAPPESPPHEVFVLRPTEQDSGVDVPPELERRLAAHDDPLMQPLRMVWLPPERDGARVARLRDVLTFTNPRNPTAVQQLLLQTRSG
ncbi:MAG: hypothetical protein K1X95_11520, partial [Acidimicrobiia bacterium]|nr:hypothetical protein [Acidimicrobiia bacterium]